MDGQEFQIGANGTDRLPTLRDLATPMFRRPKLVIFTFAGLLLATVLGTLLLPRDNYESTMKILVKRDRVDAAVSPGRDAAMPNPGEVTEEEINSEVELLKSRDLLEKVVVSCNLQDLPSSAIWSRLVPSAATREADSEQDSQKKISRAVATLENKLQIEPLKKTDMIQVTYSSADPQLAARVLRTLGESLSGEDRRGSPSPGRVRVFSVRIAALRSGTAGGAGSARPVRPRKGSDRSGA